MIITLNDGYGAMSLVCPICLDPHTHLDSVQLLTPVRAHEHQNYGMRLDAAGEDAHCHITASAAEHDLDGGRRHAIEIIGTCESSCQWVTRLAQHKGTTYVTWHGTDRDGNKVGSE